MSVPDGSKQRCHVGHHEKHKIIGINLTGTRGKNI
jgi:hypothetical protein